MPDAKTQTLEKTFKQPFDIERYLTFATEFFKDVRIDSPEDESPITAVEFANVAAGIIRVGVYSSPNGETVNILAVRLHRGRSVERARSVQRNFVAREIAEHNHDAAIVAFYSDDDDRWRLSFVRLDYKFADGKFTKDLSPAKRYSYLVGKGEPCHTAIKQLLPIFAEEDYSPTLDKIEEAFSVEAVTKDFFELYKERYLDLKEQLEANKEFIKEADRNNFTSEQFAKKLMGQIVFLYFLQKKGWLGVKVIKPSISIDEFDKLKGFSDAAAKIIPTIYARAGDAYELDEKLFKSKDFSDADADLVATAFVASGIEGVQKWGDGSRHYLRDLFDECKDNKNASNFFNDYLEHLFYEALNNKRGASHYYRRFNCRIPFLNGGLFQHEYDWAHTDFGLSDDIFSNDGGKRGEPDGILDIFDRFNFTMNEDEPLEREVAVDPEMLGKIFENLLEVSDRKSKGAFYTPREIVHYMCRETLINYLAGECQIPSADIREFILYGEQMRDCDLSIDELKYISRSVYQKLGAIDRALNDIRVADPAVGSGAFLLGMLNEIVKIQNNITEYLVAREPNKIAKERRRADRELYKLKWNAIKNCLYAVDIEQSAVDIAKLRLWLSLVVDAEIDEDSQSDPKTLPNLDYNIMCGNSLKDEYQGVKLFDDSMLSAGETKSSSMQHQIFLDDVEMKIKELREEQNAFFDEEDPDRKKSRKKRIDELVDDVIITKLKMENKSNLIEGYIILKESGSMPFFLWGLEFTRVFQDKGGFDVIIGNPPYGMLNKKQNQNTSIIVSNDDISYYKKNPLYMPARGGIINIFRLFICKSFDILRNEGCLSLIFPMAFMGDLTSANLRKYILDNHKIDYIEAFPERDNENKRVFRSAKISVCILGATKSNHNSEPKLPLRIHRDKYVDTSNEITWVNRNELAIIDGASLAIPLLLPKEYGIMLKICKDCKRVRDFSKCYDGEIHMTHDNKYTSTNPSHSIMLRGAQVQKFRTTDKISQGEILYVDEKSYLSENTSEKSSHHAYRRLIMQGITGVNEKYRLKMTICNEGTYLANSVNYLLLDDNHIYYFLGLGNSLLLNWYFSKLSTNSNVNGYEVDNLPIKISDVHTKGLIEAEAKKLLDDPENVQSYNHLNALVYSLFDITEEEISVIENL